MRQCDLVSISRSSFYREPTPDSTENLVLMRLIDEQFLETPWYGSRQMARHLRRNGWCVGRHRVRLMQRISTNLLIAPAVVSSSRASQIVRASGTSSMPAS